MKITKEQMFEIYIKAASFNKAEDGLFITPEGGKISEEGLRGSAEFAGFIDGVLGNSPKYLPPKGIIDPERTANDRLVSLVRSLARAGEEYEGVVGKEILEKGKRVGYLEGYRLGLEHKGFQQRKPYADDRRAGTLAVDGNQNIVRLDEFRARTRGG